LAGLAVGTVVALVFPTWRKGTVAVRPVHAVRFAGYFLYQLVASSVTVARTVVSPSHRVHTGIIAVPLSGCSDALATLIADAISLTPGTLTLEVRRDPLMLYVHALDLRDVERVQADVRRLEVLAVRAFGSAEAIAGLDVDDTSSWRGR
jgi:multicomponent Na+:H+ antiporter subunit E